MGERSSTACRPGKRSINVWSWRLSILLSALLILALLPAAAAGAPPTAVAEAATEVGATTARAHGVIGPRAQETFYRFDYITDATYRRNVAEGKEAFAGAASDGFGWLLAGTAGVPVSALLGEAGGLEPGSEYHLRLVVENIEGTAIAVAQNFLTPKPLEPIPCFGDNCQVLPPEPRDPGLSTTVPGVGNPKVHYAHYGSKAKPRKSKRKKHHRSRRHHKKNGGSRPAGAAK
ncbi:MAG TPA: hypothetical protein VN522_07105 [Solirubrobacterales bacterium]|nr:hypothetical protein [Solirubrobacterales bacterium]